MLSVEETNAALAKEHAEEELTEQGLLPKSSEPKAPEVSPPKAVSVENQVGSSVSTELIRAWVRWSTPARAGRKYLPQ